ncbi:RidA family protein [Rhizorhabdus wittichii]|uniref:RidA family protein n=1 Tax=Rhizorhabdus wittichii TaxID=160791 RepID=UPI0002E8F23A|nr:RidA family protein [Rhizorhabdus wittichii]
MISGPGVALENPAGVHAPAGQYSHVATVAAGSELIYFAGQVGARADGELEHGFEAQVRRTFENLFALLEAKGLSPANLVRLNYYLTAVDQAGELRRIRRDYLPGPAPATTALVVQLLDPAWLFEMDAVAVRPLA